MDRESSEHLLLILRHPRHSAFDLGAHLQQVGARAIGPGVYLVAAGEKGRNRILPLARAIRRHGGLAICACGSLLSPNRSGEANPS
jgi:hypothetical protein